MDVPFLNLPEADPPNEGQGEEFEHQDFFDLNDVQEQLGLTDEQFEQFQYRAWDPVVCIETPTGRGSGYLFRTPLPAGRAVMTNSHVIGNHPVTWVTVTFFAELGTQSVTCRGTRRIAESFPVSAGDDGNHDFYFFEFELPDDPLQRNRVEQVLANVWEEQIPRVDAAETPAPFVNFMPDDFTVEGRTALLMIGHPRGGLKKLSFGNLLTLANQPFPDSAVRVYHMNSRPGNSGSPVFVRVGFQRQHAGIFGPWPLLLHFRNGFGMRYREAIADDIRYQFVHGARERA